MSFFKHNGEPSGDISETEIAWQEEEDAIDHVERCERGENGVEAQEWAQQFYSRKPLGTWMS
jgi:hypothetical protein